jgi:hypothetical protein
VPGNQLKNFALTLSLALSGCVGIGLRGGVGGDDLKNIKRVAVFANLPSTMMLGAEYPTFDVAEWKVNQYVQYFIVTQLEKNPQYDVGTLANAPALENSINKDALISLKEEARREGFDTLVILNPSKYDNALSLRPGYGIARASRWSHHWFVYMLAIVSVYDTSKPTAIGWQWTFDPINGKPNIMSSEELPWREDPKTFTAKEFRQIQSILKRHIEAQITYSLKANNLIK